MTTDQAAVELPQHVLDFLRQQMTLTLATASAGAVPRATPLVYVNDGPVLFVWLRAGSTAARHVEHNPAVSFAISEYSDDWRQTRGLQGTGECRVVLSGEQIALVAMLFGEKYPTLSPGSSTTGISFMRIAPTQLQYVDNERAEPGQKPTPEEFGVDYHRELVYSVFRDLPAQAGLTISGEMQPLAVDEGEVIVRQGAPADKFFIVVEGEVEVTREEQGGARTLETLGPGQLLGEIAIMRDLPRAATVRATKPTRLLAMERETFHSLVARSLGVAEDFDRVIHERLERLGARDRGT